MTASRWIAVLCTGLLLALTGCGSEESSNPAEPPEGWNTTETRWWKSGVDTSKAFRTMEDLEQMGIVPDEFAIDQSGLSQSQFNNAIKRTLVKLYRNDPEAIDTLFTKYAIPVLEEADLSGEDVVTDGGRLNSDLQTEFKNKAYEAINNHYREPRRQEGQDLNIVYPESLRTTSGRVELQVHLAVEGEGSEAVARPDAIKVLQSVQPTLDAIVMKAASQLTYQPAFVKKDGEWMPQDSWVRFGTTYPELGR